MSHPRKSNSFLKNEDGSAAIEFGLVSLVFIMLVIGIFETGRMFLYWNTFQYAVEDSLRYVMIAKNNDQDIADSDLEVYISEKMSLFGVSSEDIDLTISAPYKLSGVSFIDISGTLEFEALVPFLPKETRTFILEADARLPMPRP